MKFLNAVIITGSIACGKSSACDILKNLGYAVIDADIAAKEAMQICKNSVTKTFDCLDNNGNIDRQKLANIIFSDNAKKKELEDILHPVIYDIICTQAKILEEKNKIYFLDIPLYFETGKKYKAKAVICICAPYEILLKRLQKRNNLNEEQAKKRIASQIDCKQKAQMSDFVIMNDSTLKELETKLKTILEKL